MTRCTANISTIKHTMMKGRNRSAIFMLFVLLICAAPGISHAQQADNGDGTFTNPVIWADFPDNDVIRVGDTYYMVCTTMYFFPGVPILQSKDLVNWEYASNVVPRFDLHPFYDMQGGNRYGKGQWASSIRHHQGKFYILFLTLDEGGFLYTAEDANGPWQLHKLPRAFYDAGMFFDDDGKNYVVHGFSKIHITEVDDALHPLTTDSLIYDKGERPGLEGSHMYKKDGYYYIYATYGGGDGYQTCLRSKNVYGPYEEKIILKDDMNLKGMGIHQGALVQTQTGEWWSIIFQDRIGVGRVPTLQPVSWKDNWPVVGRDGRAVVTFRKPDVGKKWPVTVLPTSDEFDHSTLGMQWAWNHNPEDSKWSLTERKGFLRLKTAQIAADLPSARNSLSQRMFGPSSSASTAMDIGHMKEGDLAGLGVLQVPYALIGVKANGQKKSIVMVNNGKTMANVPLGPVNKVYLQAFANATTDEVSYAYSFDNKKFLPLGDTLHMKFDLKMFTGNRFVLFNYATLKNGGFVDVDWFRMETKKGPPNLYAASSRIKADRYDEIHLAKVGTVNNQHWNAGQVITHTINGSWLTFNQIYFDKNYTQMNIAVCPQNDGGKINIYLDQDTVHPHSSIPVPPGTGGIYQTLRVPIHISPGKHAITLKFESSQAPVADIDWFSFSNTNK